MTAILANAFSLNMLPEDFSGCLEVREVSSALKSLLADGAVVNSIGHPATDVVVRELLAQDGIYVPAGERMTVTMQPDDVLIVAQYVGDRLPEGATTLPAGARIVWRAVSTVACCSDNS